MTQADPDVSEPLGQMPRWFALLSSVSTRLNQIAAALAAILLTLMVALILLEIVLRFFSKSTFMADALVGHGVAAITFLALGWTLEQGSMIRISALTQRLTPAGRYIASFFSIISTELLIIWLMYFQWRTVNKLWLRGTTSEHHLPIPLWIPDAFFLIGLTLLAFQLLVQLARLCVTGRDSNAALNL